MKMKIRPLKIQIRSLHPNPRDGLREAACCLKLANDLQKGALPRIDDAGKTASCSLLLIFFLPLFERIRLLNHFNNVCYNSK